MRPVVFLALVLGAYAGEATLPGKTGPRSSPGVWFTQLGRWHLVKDSAGVRSHLFHNAALDGAQSGQANADIKYNRPFSRLERISVQFSLGSIRSCAGLLLKSGALAYYFMLDRSVGGDSLLVIRRFGKKDNQIASFAVTAADTQRLELTVSTDSLQLITGGVLKKIARPADLPDTLTMGLACREGSVSVWSIFIGSPSLAIDESFDSAMVINLGLERMFPGKKVHKRPTTTP